MAGFHLGRDEESEPGGTFTQTVFEGVFHDGLEDEAGDKNLSSGCRGGDSGLQFASETDFLDFEVGCGGIEFDGQWCDQFMTVIERIF